MKKYFLTIVVALFFSSGNCQTVAQTRCNNLGSGINLSNWLDAFWDPNWRVADVYDKAFLVEMKNAGMKSFRLPVCFALISDTLPPYTVDTSSPVFQLIDSAFSWADELNMNVVIDNHNQWALNDTSWRNVTPRLSHLWAVLANRYQHLDPNRYVFEVMNEPANIHNDSLRILLATVIDTIRQYAPAHTIVVSPTSWSNGVGYSNWVPLADTNLLYTMHSYDPYPFTHQGLSWVNPPLPTGVVFPHPVFNALINVNWGLAMLWKDSFKLPMFLGEFGVGMYADENSRCNWADTIGALIDLNHLPSFSWDVRGSFPIYNSGVVSRDSIMPCFSKALHLYENQGSDIYDTPEELSFQLQPNPANETLTVICADRQSRHLQLYNCAGALLKQFQFEGNIHIDVSGLPAGFYLVKVNEGPKAGLRKLVLSK